MRPTDFDYHLPPDLIAQHPAEKRDASRLLVVNRSDGRFEHRRFQDFPDFLGTGDVLVINDSRVIPARLRAVKPETGGSVEVLLLEEVRKNEWWVMLKPGKRVRQGPLLKFLDKTNQPPPCRAEVLDKSSEGPYRLKFDGTEDHQTEIRQI
jgi:S-adenosylmethionine:tRNA ribosyltransferase-isomerase